jgi:hypothetical protein
MQITVQSGADADQYVQIHVLVFRHLGQGGVADSRQPRKLFSLDFLVYQQLPQLFVADFHPAHPAFDKHTYGNHSLTAYHKKGPIERKYRDLSHKIRDT